MSGRSCIEKYYLRRSLISYLLYPLSLLFSALLIFRRYLYKTILTQYTAPVFVISIGNIILGGSGKTPFTIYLAELLSRQGLKAGVSHRGYKSKLENEVALISDRSDLFTIADDAGDEAWLIAKRLPGIPVVVGKNRSQAIQLLCKTYPDLDLVILDDSFQHLKVKHDLDIVIVSETLGFGNGLVLPAGYLREPLSALQNSDLLILNRQNKENELNAKLSKQIAQTGKPLLTGSYQPDKFYNFYGQTMQVDDIISDKVIMTSGIGNPDGFNDFIRACGLELTGGIMFKDHYDFQNKASRENILKLMHQRKAKWVAVTEKDYAKLRFYPEFADCLLVFPINFSPDFAELTLLKSIPLSNQV